MESIGQSKVGLTKADLGNHRWETDNTMSLNIAETFELLLT